MTQEINILEPIEFTTSVIEEMQKSPNQNWNMHFFQYDRGHLAEPLWRAVKEIPSKGGRVKVTLDDFSTCLVDGKLVHLFSGRDDRRRMKIKLDLEQELRDRNVDVRYVNPIKGPFRYTPIFGRSHMKFVASEQDLWIGSTNLSDESIRRQDSMLYIRDAKIAGFAREVSEAIYAGTKLSNTRFPGEDWELLFDGGKFGRSIIYDTAEELIACASSKITMITPHLPDGSIVQRLREAGKRNVLTEVITSDPRRRHESAVEWMRWPTPLEGIPIFYPNGRWVHVKALLVDDRYAIFGSHNLTEKSNYLGTREMSLLTVNPAQTQAINKWRNSAFLELMQTCN